MGISRYSLSYNISHSAIGSLLYDFPSLKAPTFKTENGAALLTTLDLSNCSRLTTLPEQLGLLTLLTTLNLSDCSALTTLPEQLGSLTLLTTFDLSDCSALTMLPSSIANLDQLTRLSVSDCIDLNNPPYHLCRSWRSAHDVQKFFTPRKPWSRQRRVVFGPVVNEVFAAVLLGYSRLMSWENDCDPAELVS